MLGEDVEDQRDPVDDVAREERLEVALLRGRQLVVEHDDVDVERLAELAQLLGLALPDVGGGVGRRAPLQRDVHRLGARGLGEQRELDERLLRGFDAAGAEAGADEQRPLLDDTEIDLGRGEPPAAPTGRSRFASAHEGSIRGRRAIDVDVEDVGDGAAEHDRLAQADAQLAARARRR